MGMRAKGKIPESLLGPRSFATPVGVQVMEVVDVRIAVPPQPPRSKRFEEIVRASTTEVLEDSLERLRAGGASEQELESLIGSVRMVCLLRLLEEDLNDVVLRYIESGGQTEPLRRVVSRVLVPELIEDL